MCGSILGSSRDCPKELDKSINKLCALKINVGQLTPFPALQPAPAFDTNFVVLLL